MSKINLPIALELAFPIHPSLIKFADALEHHVNNAMIDDYDVHTYHAYAYLLSASKSYRNTALYISKQEDTGMHFFCFDIEMATYDSFYINGYSIRGALDKSVPYMDVTQREYLTPDFIEFNSYCVSSELKEKR